LVVLFTDLFVVNMWIFTFTEKWSANLYRLFQSCTEDTSDKRTLLVCLQFSIYCHQVWH